MFSIGCIAVLSLGHFRVYLSCGRITVINSMCMYIFIRYRYCQHVGDKEKNCAPSCQHGGWLPIDEIGQSSIAFGAFGFRTILDSMATKCQFGLLVVLGDVFFRLAFASLARGFRLFCRDRSKKTAECNAKLRLAKSVCAETGNNGKIEAAYSHATWRCLLDACPCCNVIIYNII